MDNFCGEMVVVPAMFANGRPAGDLCTRLSAHQHNCELATAEWNEVWRGCFQPMKQKFNAYAYLGVDIDARKETTHFLLTKGDAAGWPGPHKELS